MLATGLLVLKIIGLILLGILGLILALLLIVLLVPVRYRAEGTYQEELKGKASVSWLLHMLSCSVVYDGELDLAVRVFGLRIGKKDDKGAAEAAEAEEAEADDEVRETIIEPDDTAPAQTESEAGVAPEVVEPPPASPEEQQKNLEEEILQELKAEREEEVRTERSHKKKRKKKKFSFQKICDKLKDIGQQKDKAAEFLKDEKNQKTFHLLIRQLKALLKHILPRKLRGRARFGFDDPYTTGQVLMYISPFYGLYGKRFQIIPVFEEPVLEGEAWLKGRIRVGTVLILAIRVLLDQNFRTILKNWRK